MIRPTLAITTVHRAKATTGMTTLFEGFKVFDSSLSPMRPRLSGIIVRDQLKTGSTNNEAKIQIPALSRVESKASVDKTPFK